MVTRRSFLLAAALAPVARIVDVRPPAAPRAMRLCMHQNTSRGAGFRASLEGWSRAGIRYAELSDGLLDDFLEDDTLAGARGLLADVGVTPACGAAVIPDLWLPGPGREANLETWRRRCDQYSSLGLDKIYCPSFTSRAVTAEDFAATPACVREAGDIARAHGLTAMIEFTRTSRHLATLTSSLNVIRAADHESVRPMLDFFHFWSGMSKLEDLDLLRPGELLHAHFQDVLDTPRELIDNDARLIPGDGVAPVVRILRTLTEKEYTGALSVELFRAEFVAGDPFEVASEIRRKCEAVMSEAGVL
jgi:sugar phosphate isomerase/epimerase